jgi:hypothetical protein
MGKKSLDIEENQKTFATFPLYLYLGSNFLCVILKYWDSF